MSSFWLRELNHKLVSNLLILSFETVSYDGQIKCGLLYYLRSEFNIFEVHFLNITLSITKRPLLLLTAAKVSVFAISNVNCFWNTLYIYIGTTLRCAIIVCLGFAETICPCKLFTHVNLLLLLF